MGNVTVAWEDVMAVVSQVQNYLIGIVALLVLAIVVIIAALVKMKKPLKGFVSLQALIAFVVATVVIVNAMLTGPLYSTLNVVLTDAGTLQEETVATSRQLIEDITAEGIILAKNENGGLPLAPSSLNNGQINVFGWASTSPIYGGTGSGAVDVSTAVDILGGLKNAGYTVNQELIDKYTAYRDNRPSIEINNGQDWSLPEPPADTYDQALMDNAKAFSDWAVVVLARSGGEGADLPNDMGKVLDGALNSEIRPGYTVHAQGSYWQGTKYTNALYTPNSDAYADFEYGQHYLELSRTEKDLIDLVTSNFDNVVIVYNGANTMEMGWTEDYPQIKSVLLVAGPGATGFNALGKIMAGDVNPSGKTVDLWARDLTAAPWYNNIGHFNYTDGTSLAVAAAAREVWPRSDGYVTFVDYVENIYVGYKFYETAYAEQQRIAAEAAELLAAAAEGETPELPALGFDFDYDASVMYPFGYGLSYTTFEQALDSVNISGTTVTANVTVTNTGDVAGKDVVELYFTPPYVNGGIEKAAVNLVAFDKTGVIEPGASEQVTLTFELEDMASFDAKTVGGYVLEAGDYEISLRTDSHTVVASETIAVDEIVYTGDNAHNGDLITAEPRFDYALGDVTYLSRADGFANYNEATAAPTDFTLDTVVYANGSWDPLEHNDPNEPVPTTGAKGSLKLADLRGADYDDPRWEQLLDQVTVEEMVELIQRGGHQTAAVASVGKLRTLDTDGPAGVNSSTLGVFGTGYCCNVIISQTWNRQMAYDAAEGIAREFHDFGIVGWYAPSMNIHRSAFAGRNFEYYSEDGYLSGELAREQVMASESQDVYPYIKHFALNDQETNRNGILCTWTTEQAMREIYLKPFEEAVKVATPGKLAIMSSYNYIGSVWAGENPQLLQDVLRGEWGFKGMVLSDYFGNYGYMNAERAIRGGTDIMLDVAGNAIITDTTSGTSLQAMRQATKNIFYTTVNSAVYEGDAATGTPGWLKTAYMIEGAVIALMAICEFLLVRGFMKKKKKAA